MKHNNIAPRLEKTLSSVIAAAVFLILIIPALTARGGWAESQPPPPQRNTADYINAGTSLQSKIGPLRISTTPSPVVGLAVLPGKVGLGTTPSEKLTVLGNINFTNIGTGGISVNGNTGNVNQVLKKISPTALGWALPIIYAQGFGINLVPISGSTKIDGDELEVQRRVIVPTTASGDCGTVALSTSNGIFRINQNGTVNCHSVTTGNCVLGNNSFLPGYRCRAPIAFVNCQPARNLYTVFTCGSGTNWSYESVCSGGAPVNNICPPAY